MDPDRPAPTGRRGREVPPHWGGLGVAWQLQATFSPPFCPHPLYSPDRSQHSKQRTNLELKGQQTISNGDPLGTKDQSETQTLQRLTLGEVEEAVEHLVQDGEQEQPLTKKHCASTTKTGNA